MNVISIKSHHHKYQAGIYKLFMYLLNIEGIQSPVPLSSIGKFESQNERFHYNKTSLSRYWQISRSGLSVIRIISNEYSTNIQIFNKFPIFVYLVIIFTEITKISRNPRELLTYFFSGGDI